MLKTLQEASEIHRHARTMLISILWKEMETSLSISSLSRSYQMMSTVITAALTIHKTHNLIQEEVEKINFQIWQKKILSQNQQGRKILLTMIFRLIRCNYNHIRIPLHKVFLITRMDISNNTALSILKTKGLAADLQRNSI